MKKFFGCAALLAGVVFASCDNKENSYNFVSIVYPAAGEAVLYADQTSDSLRFVTTYDWSLALMADWMHAEGEAMAGEVPAGYFLNQKMNLQFDVNLTDTVRVGFVYLYADGKQFGTYYTQKHYLNVTHPFSPDGSFVLEDSAMQVRDSLVFTTYGDGWTLAFKGERPSWIDFEAGAATTGKAGKHSVAYTLEPNTSENERTAVLQLTSKGVTTDIRVRQYGLKQEGSEE